MMEQTLVEAAWARLRSDARKAADNGALLEGASQQLVLSKASLAECIAAMLEHRLAGHPFADGALCALAADIYADQGLITGAARDIEAAWARNVATESLLGPALFQKGSCALIAHRIVHALWHSGDRESASALQCHVADRLGVDIHPGAQLGAGIFIDHGTGVVIGETAIVEDEVAMWHGICLGSDFKKAGQRHPVIRKGAILAAGAIILGNVEIGAGAVVAAGSVVLANVRAGVTVAGSPARVVSEKTNVALVQPIAGRSLA